MSSSHDENQRAELNGTEPAGEELAPAMAQHDAMYDPGPSFIEHDRPTVRLAELPAWLQRFAASAGDPDDMGQESYDVAEMENITQLPTPAPQSEPESPSIELPSWLDDDESVDPEPMPEPPAPETDSVAEAPVPGTPQFMISEDDLPDWLRTISSGEGGAEVPAGVAAQPSMATAGVASVPSVARAWVTREDMDALSEGGSLFALVASQTTSSHVADAPEPAPEPRPSRGKSASRTSRGEAATVAVANAPAAQDASTQAGEDEQSEERNFRLLPVLIGALLVVVIVMLAMNFVL